MSQLWFTVTIWALFFASLIVAQDLSCSDPSIGVVETYTILNGHSHISDWWIDGDDGENQIGFLLVYNLTSHNHRLYRSDDFGVTFEDQTPKLPDAETPSPIDEGHSGIYQLSFSEHTDAIYLIGYDDRVYVSHDKGVTYSNFSTDIYWNRIIAHPYISQYAIGSTFTPCCASICSAGTCRNDLYFTSNGGAAWTLVQEFVSETYFSWRNRSATDTGIEFLQISHPDPTINQFLMDSSQSNYTLMEDVTVNTKQVPLSGVGAYLSDGDLRVVVDTSNWTLYMSSDYAQTFSVAEYPPYYQQGIRPFALAYDERTAMMALMRSPSYRTGELYVNNAGLTNFSLSLVGLYMGNNGLFHFTPTSVPGTYLAAATTVDKLLNPITLRSMNQGGQWTPSMIQLRESSMQSDYFTASDGFIAAIGHQGTMIFQETEDAEAVWVSEDAGETWNLLLEDVWTIHSTYQLGIIALFDDVSSPSLRYTYNIRAAPSSCTLQKSVIPQHRFIPGQSKRPILSTLVTLDDATDPDHSLAVLSLTFPIPECVAANMSTNWSTDCILGASTTYTRKQYDAACYVSATQPQTETICTCRAADYVCDYCFVAVNGTCEPQSGCDLGQNCTEGQNFTLPGRTGYRKLAASQCTMDPQQPDPTVGDGVFLCGADVKVFPDPVVEEPIPMDWPPEEVPTGLSSGAIVGIVLGCVCFAVLVALLIALAVRSYRKKAQERDGYHREEL